MPTVEELVYNMILFVFLPLWLICGGIDYWCHRRTKIEENSGVKESIQHCLMGLQVGVPMFLVIYLEVTVGVLLVCIAFFIWHEITAHRDLVLAEDQRVISVWEQHVHGYLGTIPFFLLMLVLAFNWTTVLDLVQFNWSGKMGFSLREDPVGPNNYMLWYASFMMFLAIIPYTEELIRCIRYAKKVR